MTDDAKTMLCCCCFCAMRKMCVCSRTTTTILDYIWLLLGFCVLQAFGNNWLDGFRDFMQIILLCIWSNFLFYAAGVLDDKLSSTQQKNIGISMECNPEIDGFWWTAWNSIGKTAFFFLFVSHGSVFDWKWNMRSVSYFPLIFLSFVTSLIETPCAILSVRCRWQANNCTMRHKAINKIEAFAVFPRRIFCFPDRARYSSPLHAYLFFHIHYTLRPRYGRAIQH